MKRLIVLGFALAFVAPPALAQQGGRIIQKPAVQCGAACGAGAGRSAPGAQSSYGFKQPSYGVKPQSPGAMGAAPRNDQFGAMKGTGDKSKAFNTERKPLRGLLEPRSR